MKKRGGREKIALGDLGFSSKVQKLVQYNALQTSSWHCRFMMIHYTSTMMMMWMKMMMMMMMIIVKVHDDGPHWDRPDNVRTSKAGRIDVHSHGGFSQVRESGYSRHQFCFHCFHLWLFICFDRRKALALPFSTALGVHFDQLTREEFRATINCNWNWLDGTSLLWRGDYKYPNKCFGK